MPKIKSLADTKTVESSKSADDSTYFEEKIDSSQPTAAHQNVENPNNSSNQVNDFFEINESFIFGDVPENENTLETLMTNKNCKSKVSYLDENKSNETELVSKNQNSSEESHQIYENNSDETELVSKNLNLSTESHQIYSSRRAYTRKSDESNHTSEKQCNIGKKQNSEVNRSKIGSNSESELNVSKTRVFHVRIPIPGNSTQQTFTKSKESVETALTQVIKTIRKPDITLKSVSLCNGDTSHKKNSLDSNADNLCISDKTRSSLSMNLAQHTSSNFQIKGLKESKPSTSAGCQNLRHPHVSLADLVSDREHFKKQLKDKRDLSYVDKILSLTVNERDETSYQNVNSCDKMNEIETLPESKKSVKKRNSRKKEKVKNIDNLKDKLGLMNNDEFQSHKTDRNSKISSSAMKSNETDIETLDNFQELTDVKMLLESKCPVKKRNRKKGRVQDIDNSEENLVLNNSEDPKLSNDEINNKISSTAFNENDETNSQNVDNLQELYDVKSSLESISPVKKCNRKKGKVKNIENLDEELGLINNDEPQLSDNEIINKISSTAMNKSDKTINQNMGNANELNDVKMLLKSKRSCKKQSRNRGKGEKIDNLEEILSLVKSDEPQLPYKKKNKINVVGLEGNLVYNVQNTTGNISSQNSDVLNNKQGDGNLSIDSNLSSRKIVDIMRNDVEKKNIAKYYLKKSISSTKEISESTKYSPEKSSESSFMNRKCDKLVPETSKLDLFNGTCDEIKHFETSNSSSNRAPPTLSEMFKKYTDKSDIFSSPEDLPVVQSNLIQNILANSYLPRTPKRSNKLLYFDNVNSSELIDKSTSSNNIEDLIKTDLPLSLNNESKERKKYFSPNISRDSKKTETLCPEPLSSNTFDQINSECLNTTSNKKYKKRSKSLTKTIPASLSVITPTSSNKSSRYRRQRSVSVDPIFSYSNSDFANTNDVDNKSIKGDIETKSTSKSNAKEAVNTSVFHAQLPANYSSPQTVSKSKKSVTTALKRGRNKKKAVELSLDSLDNLTNNSLTKTDDKNSRNVSKKPERTISKLLSSRMQTRTSAKCNAETKTERKELPKKNNTLKMPYSIRSLNDVLCAGNEVVDNETASRDLNEENNLSFTAVDSRTQTKKQMRSTSVDSKLHNSLYSIDISNQAFNVSLKGGHSSKRKHRRCRSLGPVHILNLPSTSQNKTSNEPAINNGIDNSSTINPLHSSVKSKRRKRFPSEGDKSNISHYSVENVSNQVTEGRSLKRRNSLKSRDKTSPSLELNLNSNVRISRKSKVSNPQNLQKFKNEDTLNHSSLLSESLNIVSEPHNEDRSHSSDCDSLDEFPSQNLNTETQFSEQKAYQSFSFPVQTPNTPFFSPTNNSFTYGNSMVQYPQLLNQRVFPNMNQFVVQPPNPYYIQNPYGNFNVPSFNIVSPQSVTYPVYQNRPTLQSSNFPCTLSNPNFVFQPNSVVPYTPNATNISLNPNYNHLNFPNKQNFSRNSPVKRKKRYLINSDVITEETTTKICRKPEVIENFGEKMKSYVEQNLNGSCLFDLNDFRTTWLSKNKPTSNMTVRELVTNPLLLRSLKNIICTKIPEFDVSPKVEYVFEESFFDSPFREVIKDYIDFHLQCLYKEPAFKDYFINIAYKKFPFRDCSFLSQALPKENINTDFQDLIGYMSISGFCVILNECAKRNLIKL